ncbi:right-handed parallel beta-helix repeat-containing protein [Bartonella schoenbuchensis]|uniref:right-handed parallel beta-helix repeat-containing protein n=1 Tax=Bartonella schoenbuchensis TaxID=165694 RepID=UPI0031450829
MVMRRVFNRHVCFCVLSTAILAGLALMTSQTKVYAAQNCKGLTNSGPSGDKGEEPIVCDGKSGGTGAGGVLSGRRDIDMSGKSGQAAVTVTGANTKIRIKSTLTVTNSSGTGNNTAIKVDKGGVLMLVGGVNVTGVQKGMEVSGSGSSVTVMKGSIGVRKGGGGSLIEVKNGGEVVFNRGVTVGPISESGEVVVINNGGTVELNKVQLKDVTTGIVVRGNNTTANVRGKATITVKQDGTGFKMQGQGTADVVELEIKGSGGNGTGAEVSSGTLKMTRVTLKDLATGAKVTGQGTLRMIGDSTITVGQNGTGVEVSNNGKVEMMGATIKVVGSGGKGLVMKGGTANVVMGSITGSGNGTGLVMEGTADVTLTNVDVLNVQKGVEMRGGTLTVNGKSKIKVVGGGTGMSVSGGNTTMMGGEITAGNTGTGLNVGGKANVILTSVTMKQVGTGAKVTGGKLTVNGTTTINVTGNGTGISVGGGEVTMMGTTTINVAAGGTGLKVTKGMVMMSGKTTINVAAGGTGLDVTDGTVMMNGGLTITGSGEKGVSVGGGEGVWLTNVDISQFTTGITMTGGEKLTVEGGSITGSGGSGVGINVTRGNGNVTVEGVEISKFATGIYMTGTGGTLTVSGGSIGFTGGYGIKVGEKVQSTNLTGVEIKGSGGSGNRGVEVEGGEVTMNTVNVSNVGTGVDMETGVKNASLTNVNISRAERGIYMDGSGTFTVSGTTIQFTGNDQYGYGVYAGEKVTSTSLKDVTIVGKGSGGGSKGVWLKGGEVMMKQVDISNVATGIVMEKGVKSASLKGMTIKGVKMGIVMKGKGELKVEGVGISFTGGVSYEYGIGVGDKVTRATLTGVEIKGSGKGSGVFMMGGEVTMERVNVSQVATGIWVTGGTLIMKEGTKIGFTKDYGIKLGKEVTEATLTKVEIVGKGKGEGIYAEGGVLMVSGGEIKEVEKGITMMGGALTVKKEAKINFTGEHGIKLGKGVTGEVKIEKGTKITGSNRGKGVVWESTGMLTLDGVEMLKVATGVYATGSGELKVEGGEINFMGEYGYGVMVGKEVRSTSLTDVKITGRGKTGVLMGSTGTLTKVEISGVQIGVEVAGSGKLTMKDGEIQFTEVGLKVEGETTATATVTGTKIVGSGSNGMSKGIYVGKGSLMLTGVGISMVTTGVEMRAGKSLTVKEGKIEFMGIYGVMVGKSVTEASLTDVTIVGSGNSGVGVYARSGNLTVSGGSITGVEEGIAMTEGKSLTVKDNTRIEFTGEYGIKLGGTVGALVTNVEITGSRKGDGIYAEGGVLMVSGGSIKGVERGITMMGYGVLIMKDNTTIEFKEDGIGVYVGKSVTANLKGTVIRGSGNNGVGVYTVGGKVLTMTKVDISNVGTGVYAMGGTLIMKDGEIGFMRAYGVAIEGGAAALMGVNMTYKGDNRDPQDADVVSPSFIKVDGGKVVAEKVTMTGNGKDNIQGLHVTQRGHVVLMNSTYTDVYSGMTIEEGTVRMFGGSVEFKGEHAISLSRGNAILKDVNMTYKGDNRDPQGADVVSPSFIKVEKGTVAAESLTITGNGKDNIQGVKVANGGAVWLKNTTFTNVRSGMTIERGGIMRMEGGSITFTGGHGIDVSGGQAILSGFSITRQGDTSKATATGTGVGVSNSGKVMMRGVNISEVATGAYVTGYGLLVMDKGGITFKGKHGINLVSGYALLNGVKIMGPGSGTGIELGYGQVLMKDTTFTNVDKAITVTEGDVKMEGGEIEFKGEHGILLNQGGVALMGVTMRYKGNSTTADFIKITGEDTTNAVEAVDPKTKNTFTPKSAVVVAASLKIDGSGHGQALNVTNGGRVVLMNPTYTDVYTGMTITKGAVRMIEGSMEFTGGHGILLKQGHALLTNVTMTYKGHEQNTTFLKVEATKVVNSKNERVLNTADIRVTGIKIEGNGKGQGVYVTNGGRVMLQSALLSNVINGVSVANGEFWMKNGNIIFKGEHAVSLKTGNVVLKGVIMEYKGNNRVAKGANTTSPNFIKVEGKGANLTAIKVMITGNEQGLGVKVANGGHVTLKQSHIPIQPTIHIIHNLIL